MNFSILEVQQSTFNENGKLLIVFGCALSVEQRRRGGGQGVELYAELHIAILHSARIHVLATFRRCDTNLARRFANLKKNSTRSEQVFPFSFPYPEITLRLELSFIPPSWGQGVNLEVQV